MASITTISFEWNFKWYHLCAEAATCSDPREPRSSQRLGDMELQTWERVIVSVCLQPDLLEPLPEPPLSHPSESPLSTHPRPLAVVQKSLLEY